MNKLFVKPARAGLVVLRPTGGAAVERLPEEGAWWPFDQFLMRRLPDSGDGSVVEATPPGSPEPSGKKPKE